MKVHGKSSSPPPGGATNSSANNSFDNSSDPGSPASSTLAPSPRLPDVTSSHGGVHAQMSSPPSSHYAMTGVASAGMPPLGGSHLAGSGSLSAAHASNLSEWYVCQSAAGMPTPPSNEHSPVGLLNHIPSLHHAAMAQY